jgi:hypothetical protein
MDRDERIKYQREAENAMWRYLLYRRVWYVFCGQEKFLPTWAHGRIRFVNDNPTIDAIRHFPDMATQKMLIQVKAAASWDGHSSVTIEQASYNVCNELEKAGAPTAIVWYFPEKYPESAVNRFLAQRADKVIVREYDKDRHSANGSHTPMYLVPISCLINIDRIDF